MIAAVLFLAAYAWPILDESLGQAWRQACGVTVWVTWAVFALDYLVRLIFAENRRRYFLRHLFELAIVALPLLRPLRLLQLVTFLSALSRRAGPWLRGRVVLYITVSTSLVIFVAALAVLDAERGHPDAGITTFSDALWWGIVTTTTVGYGDLSPVTGTGQMIAAGLMIAGIALLGTVTATLASWLVERVQEEQQATSADVAELTEEVRQLRAALEHSVPSSAGTSARGRADAGGSTW